MLDGLRRRNETLNTQCGSTQFRIDGKLSWIGGGLQSFQRRSLDLADRQIECRLYVLRRSVGRFRLRERVRLNLQPRDRFLGLLDIGPDLQFGGRLRGWRGAVP